MHFLNSSEIPIPSGRPSHSWARRWRDFYSSVLVRSEKFPELLESGFFLCRPTFDWGNLDSVWSELRRLPREGTSASDRSEPSEERIGCDVILCCHTTAPAVSRPLRRLAGLLADQGYRCFIWSESERCAIFPPGLSESANLAKEEMESILRLPFSRRQRVRILMRGLLETLLLFFILGIGRRRSLVDLLRRPFSIWAALNDSGYQLARARRIWRAFKPRLLVTTHERYRPASSLLASRPPRVRSILYHHGLLSHYEQPVLSTDILAWNATDAAVLRGHNPRSVAHITGNWELEEIGFSQIPLDKSVRSELIFLSQCLSADEPFFRTATEEALEWLNTVARQCPSWSFRIKTRGPEDPLLGEIKGRLREMSVSLVSPQTSFADLLRQPQVRAVASFSSSGLFVAAGMGKLAIRLRLPSWPVPMRLIDEVSRSVGSPEEWVRVLNEPDSEKSNGEAFPARHQALAAAATVCRVAIDSGSKATGREYTRDSNWFLYRRKLSQLKR